MPFDRLPSAWPSIREAAEGHGRHASTMEMIGRADLSISATTVPGEGRGQFTGSREQIVADVAAAAEAGMDELLLDLQGSARDAQELVDLAAEFYAAVRAAGV